MSGLRVRERAGRTQGYDQGNQFLNSTSLLNYKHRIPYIHAGFLTWQFHVFLSFGLKRCLQALTMLCTQPLGPSQSVPAHPAHATGPLGHTRPLERLWGQAVLRSHMPPVYAAFLVSASGDLGEGRGRRRRAPTCSSSTGPPGTCPPGSRSHAGSEVGSLDLPFTYFLHSLITFRARFLKLRTFFSAFLL